MNEASVPVSKACPACGAHYPEDALFCPIDGSPLKKRGGTMKIDAPDGPASVESDPYLGLELSGHIVVRQLVGIGAMGRVYRAFQKGIDRDVAVKILHRELGSNTQLAARFTREAKVASRLSHPNVVQVLLAGQLADGALYIVMEYLDGLSLQSALAATDEPMPLPRALHIGLQLCDAVGEAHQQGVVHRDLKPENVMLVRRGVDDDFVKVLDFGIARVNWGEPSIATAAGLIFGTARYISPEGAQGAPASPASDVYALATLFYQLLSGRTPFDGDQTVALLVQQIHDPPPPLRSTRGGARVPEPLAEVIMANLAKDPEARVQDARAFAYAILEAAKQCGFSESDLSHPTLQRTRANPLLLPPSDRAKRFELTPELLERMGPPPNVLPKDDAPRSPRAPQGPSAPTTKWEPPVEFQAQLALAVQAARAPASDKTVVDVTLDDASAEPPPTSFARAPSASHIPTKPSPQRPDMAGRAGHPRTQYAQPLATEPTPLPRSSHVDVARSSVAPDSARGNRAARSTLVVVLCFALGALIALGVAWRMGRVFGNDAEERVVTRATDALFAGRFVDPPGDNVRDITDEGLHRFPNEARLLDLRTRAASSLVSKATSKRAEGDVAEALRLIGLARELDPNDVASARLEDQYQGELSNFSAGSVLSAPRLAPVNEPVLTPPSLPPTTASTVSPKNGPKSGSKRSPKREDARSSKDETDQNKIVPPATSSKAPSEPDPAPTPSVKWM